MLHAFFPLAPLLPTTTGDQTTLALEAAHCRLAARCRRERRGLFRGRALPVCASHPPLSTGMGRRPDAGRPARGDNLRQHLRLPPHGAATRDSGRSHGTAVHTTHADGADARLHPRRQARARTLPRTAPFKNNLKEFSPAYVTRRLARKRRLRIKNRVLRTELKLSTSIQHSVISTQSSVLS
jgi:hypothetical protein